MAIPNIQNFSPDYRWDPKEHLDLTADSFDGLPLWEAIDAGGEHAGNFDPRVSGMTAAFSPVNRTQNVKIKVYDASSPVWTDVSSHITMAGDQVIFSPILDIDPGFCGVTGTETCSSGDCFVEAKANGNLFARGIGLSSSAGTVHEYNWTSPAFDYVLTLGQIGLGSIWVKGTSVVGAFSGVTPFTYQNDDIFRVGVEVEGGVHKVRFRQNGKLLYETVPLTPPANLRPVVAFYDLNTSMENVRFWQTTYGKDEAELKVWAVMPLCQDKISEHEVTEIAEVSEAEAQRGRDKIVRYHQQQDKWDLVFSGRRLDELQTARDFRAFHRIHIPFYMADNSRGIDKLVVFETGIKDRLIQANMFDFSCTVKEY